MFPPANLTAEYNHYNNVEDDNESNDSGDVSDVEMEDMPFAWAPETLGEDTVNRGGENHDAQQKDSEASIPGSTLQQLCMAPPQLVSFKSTQESALKGNHALTVRIRMECWVRNYL